MLPLLTFELVLADQFCMIIYKKKIIFFDIEGYEYDDLMSWKH